MYKIIMAAALLVVPFTVQAQGLDDCSGPMSTATAGLANDVQLVAATSGKKVRVLSYAIRNTDTGTSRFFFKSGSGGTAIGGQWVLAQEESLVRNCYPGFCGETIEGESLFADIDSASVPGNWAVEITYALCN